MDIVLQQLLNFSFSKNKPRTVEFQNDKFQCCNDLLKNAYLALMLEKSLRKMEMRALVDYQLLKSLLVQELRSNQDLNKKNEKSIEMKYGSFSKDQFNIGTEDSPKNKTNQLFDKKFGDLALMLENCNVSFPEFEKKNIGGYLI